jgi:hypothetical protein
MLIPGRSQDPPLRQCRRYLNIPVNITQQARQPFHFLRPSSFFCHFPHVGYFGSLSLELWVKENHSTTFDRLIVVHGFPYSMTPFFCSLNVSIIHIVLNLE